MILQRTNRKTCSATESVLFTLLGPNTDGVTVFLENTDALNYINYFFQDSAVNSDTSYVTIAATGGNYGTSGILAPGGVAMVSIRTTSPFIRLKASASGGADLDYSLIQFSSNTATYYTNGVQ